MRIPNPDEALISGVDSMLARPQRAGHPLPACLMAIEGVRLALGLTAALSFALGPGHSTQDLTLCAGAALYASSALGVIPVYRSEWRGWGAELATYYRARAIRLERDAVASRLIKLVMAIAISVVIAIAHATPGLPHPSPVLSGVIAGLIWIDLLSVYAACARPRA